MIGHYEKGGEYMEKKKRRLLTAAEVAEILHITTGTLANWRFQRRGIPYHKLDHGRILYDRRDVAAYVKSSKIFPELDR
jgi:hypothetical protein